MANLYEVTFIRVSNHDGHHRITHLAGPLSHAGHYKITIEEAIEGIENGYWMFYMRIGKMAVTVIVDSSGEGDKFLRTQADEDGQNSLLALPQFRELIFP